MAEGPAGDLGVRGLSVGSVSIPFVSSLLDQLPIPALAARAVRALEADVPLWRATSVRIGESLAALRRLGVVGQSQTALIDFCNRLGLAPNEARLFADVGVAVEKAPQVAEKVASGDVTVQSAGQIGRVSAVVPAAALPEWVEKAQTVTPGEARRRSSTRRSRRSRRAPSR